MSSHILSEVEELCDRVSIIRNGRTVESGSLAELRHLTRTSVTADLDVQGHRLRLQVETDQLTAVLRTLTETGVRSLTSAPPPLEELFLRHYQDEAAWGVAVAVLLIGRVGRWPGDRR